MAIINQIQAPHKTTAMYGDVYRLVETDTGRVIQPGEKVLIDDVSRKVYSPALVYRAGCQFFRLGLSVSKYRDRACTIFIQTPISIDYDLRYRRYAIKYDPRNTHVLYGEDSKDGGIPYYKHLLDDRYQIVIDDEKLNEELLNARHNP